MPCTKIVCTIGPASESPEIIRALIKHGMNVASLNCSHGSHQEHGEKIRLYGNLPNEVEKGGRIIQGVSYPVVGTDIVEFNLKGDPLFITAMASFTFLKEVSARMIELNE